MSYPDVVLAEDDETLRRSLSDFLADEGFLVREARDLADLHAELSLGAPRVLVLDFNLPDGDCARLIEELARREDRPHVVLMSAHPGARDVAAGNGVQLLRKPFTLDALVQALLVPLDDGA